MDELRQQKVALALEYARNRGIPYYEYSPEERDVEFSKIYQSKYRSGIVGGEVLQLMHGIGLAWSYFPHHWGVPVMKMKTPLDIFNDDTLLSKALLGRLRWGGDNNIKMDGWLSDSQLRKAIRTASGSQSVSNFRPVAAATIYHKYAGAGVVWDMSCGFGGRLLGALASKAVKKYVGTEPASLTFAGLQEIAKDFAHMPVEVELHQCGSEEFTPDCPVDLCFTSPPYFNTERYSNEDSQSYVRYATPEEWNEGFLRKTMQNCMACLKDGGYMLINIANVKSHKTLEADTVTIALSEGFVLEDTLRLRLSSMTKGGFKYEPIFVFRKIIH
jgi:hypothetical protein